jgi:hypothetical protein
MTDPDVQNASGESTTVQDPGSQPPPAQAASAAPPDALAAPVEAPPPPPPSAPPPPAEVRIPEPSYELVKSDRDTNEDTFKAQGHFHPTVQTPVDAPPPAEGEAPVVTEKLPDGPPAQLLQQASGQTKLYAAIGVFLGLVVGLTLAVFFLFPGSASGTMDMGAVTSNVYGLQGHLTAKWTDKVSYNLTVEPSTPAFRPNFVTAVTSSTRPLSIDVQLKDPFGAVLCDNTVLVKFDPRNVSGPVAESDAPATQSRPGRKIDASAESRAAVARAINLARLESLELQREHGKDVFQAVAGPDGQVSSLTSQGTLPCTKKQLDGTASWTFVPDFPMVAPPAAPASGASDAAANPDQALEDAAKALEAKKELARKKARREFAPVSPYSVEGIDTIIWYDANSGIAETSAGKAFRIDTSSPAASTLKGRDFPIVIHYECDETQGCTFSGVGLGVMHARLSR